MALYSDGSFLSPLPSRPEIEPDSTLFVGVFLVDPLPEGDEYRKLVMRNCWAAPTNTSTSANATNALSFDMIAEPGCSRHSRVKVIENGADAQARFRSDAFAFAGFSQVYLFCDISICFGDCQPVSTKLPNSILFRFPR